MPASTGGYLTGEALGTADREKGRMLAGLAEGIAGVAGMVADNRDRIALEHAKATLSDQMTRHLFERAQSPSVDGNGIPVPVDVEQITADVDKSIESWRGMTGGMTTQARAELDAWIQGRREALIRQVAGQQEQGREQFYKKQGPERVFNLFLSGKELDGTRFLESYKENFPDNADVADQRASEGHFWGITQNLGGAEAKKFLKSSPPGLTPERRMELAEAADRYDRAMGKKQATLSAAQERTTIGRALDMIDADDEGLLRFVAEHTELRNKDEKVTDKEVVVGEGKLGEWKSNRYNAATTNPATKLALWGQALSMNVQPDQDQFDFRMRLAEARYGDNAKLSQEDYEKIKALLAQGYPSHEAGLLKTGYDEIARLPTRTVAVPGIMGGWAMRVKDPEAQSRALEQLVSWFDARRKQNNIPSQVDTVTYARELMVGAPAAERPAMELAQNQDQEKAKRDALLQGLNDTDRDAVLRLLRTMTVDEFMAKYGSGK